MRIVLLLFVFYCTVLTSKAQVNLVSNPSFEIFSQCPNGPSQINFATPWFQPYVTSTGVQNSNTDLFSTCCINASCQVPSNFSGSQLARTGNSYAGIWMFFKSSNQLGYEYIETKLSDTLESNKSYCFQFHISLGDKSKYAIRNIQAYFSNDSCTFFAPPYILPYVPQIQNIDTTIVKDKNTWQKISLPYQAQGGEQFITIGNFDNDSLTYKMYVGNGTVTNVAAYYYIDDVSLIDINTPASAGTDTSIAIGDTVFIGRVPEIGLNDDCIWFVNGTPIDTVAGMYVTPDTTTEYVLQQTICGTINYDTVRVTVVDPMMLKKISTTNVIHIYPNPNNGMFIMHSKQSGSYTIMIRNVLGETIYEIQSLANNTEINLSKQGKGIYFITVKGDNIFWNEKVIIE